MPLCLSVWRHIQRLIWNSGRERSHSFLDLIQSLTITFQSNSQKPYVTYPQAQISNWRLTIPVHRATLFSVLDLSTKQLQNLLHRQTWVVVRISVFHIFDAKAKNSTSVSGSFSLDCKRLIYTGPKQAHLMFVTWASVTCVKQFFCQIFGSIFRVESFLSTSGGKSVLPNTFLVSILRIKEFFPVSNININSSNITIIISLITLEFNIWAQFIPWKIL